MQINGTDLFLTEDEVVKINLSPLFVFVRFHRRTTRVRPEKHDGGLRLHGKELLLKRWPNAVFCWARLLE